MYDLTTYSIYLVILFIVFLLAVLIIRAIFRIPYRVKLQEFNLRTQLAIAEKLGVDTSKIKYDFDRLTDNSDALPEKYTGTQTGTQMEVK